MLTAIGLILLVCNVGRDNGDGWGQQGRKDSHQSFPINRAERCIHHFTTKLLRGPQWAAKLTLPEPKTQPVDLLLWNRVMTFGALFIVPINSFTTVRAEFLDFVFSLFHVNRSGGWRTFDLCRHHHQ